VAVTVLDATLPEEKLQEAVARTVSKSAHARIALVATDGAQLLRCEAPHDEAFVFPEEKDTFGSLIKRLYVRSYYSATIERYYKVRFSIRNREIQLSDEEIENDEQIQRLRKAAKVFQSHLELFRNVLKSEDFEAMEDRSDRLESLAANSKNSSSPEAVGLPESCPDCELDWTSWHGTRLRNGYERIGANTWRCTGCGTIIADNDPDNYKLA
jgi:rubrerythrin